MTEETAEQQETKEERKKRLQHEAWKRWYEGPKGQAYRLKQKMEDAGVEPEAAK